MIDQGTSMPGIDALASVIGLEPITGQTRCGRVGTPRAGRGLCHVGWSHGHQIRRRRGISPHGPASRGDDMVSQLVFRPAPGSRTKLRPIRETAPAKAGGCRWRCHAGCLGRRPALRRHRYLQVNRGRIPLRITAFRPVLPEHGIGNRCCCSVSVNAGRPCTVCAHACAHTQRLDSLACEVVQVTPQVVPMHGESRT